MNYVIEYIPLTLVLNERYMCSLSVRLKQMKRHGYYTKRKEAVLLSLANDFWDSFFLSRFNGQ